MKKATVFIALILMQGCASSRPTLTADLNEADKPCFTKRWPNAIDLLACFESAERPVIKRDAPVLLTSFEAFTARRRLLAQNFDAQIAPTNEAKRRYEQGANEASAVLMAHEPQCAPGRDSRLNKDIQAANPDRVCTSPLLVTRMACYDSIMQPIWQRDAPDTLAFYQTFQYKRLMLATTYDAVKVPEVTASATDTFRSGLTQARSAFISQSQEAIQQQRGLTQQANVTNQDQEPQPDWGLAIASSVATYANARVARDQAILNAQPQRTVCRAIAGALYCDTTSR